MAATGEQVSRSRAAGYRQSRRKVPPLLVAVLVPVTLVGLFHLTAPMRFDSAYPGFIESNEATLKLLEKKPQSAARDRAIASTRENIRWAEKYKATGIDPEFFEDLKFRKELESHVP